MTPPRPRRAIAAIFALLVASMPCLPDRLQAAEPARCTAHPVPTDSQDVVCPINAALNGRPLRFEAVFGGSHDDTRITLDAKVGDQPLTCDAGSKTSLFAEDGIVRLDCRFRVVGSGDTRLVVALTVHHAQYLSSSLIEDRAVSQRQVPTPSAIGAPSEVVVDGSAVPMTPPPRQTSPS